MAVAPATSAQDVQTSPTELWAFNPPGSASFTDVSVDHNGKVMAAVTGDGGLTNFEDDEVFAWDLTQGKTSNAPVLRHDPRASSLPTTPEGLGVVALQPAPSNKADLIAVGREGGDTDTTNDNNIYIYRISRGPETREVPTYGDGQSAPEGAVRDLWFNAAGTRLVAYHADALSLLTGSGASAKMAQQDTWRPPRSGEDIMAVDVDDDLQRIAVVTLEDPSVGSTQLRTYLLRITAGDKISQEFFTARSKDTGSAVVAISGDGARVLTGTGDRTIFYHSVRDGPDGKLNLSDPWSQNVPGAVTAIELSTDGTFFAVGFDAPGLLVYHQSTLEPSGPLATRAVDGTFTTQAAPRTLFFDDQDETLFVHAGSLFGFSSQQFDPDTQLTPLWLVPNVSHFAAAGNGHRFLVAQGDVVKAFEQSYEATLTLGTLPPATPGERLTLRLTLANTGSAPDNYAVNVKNAPPSWSVTTEPAQVALLPGKAAPVYVNVTPARTQAPGDVTLRLEALSGRSPTEPIAGTRDVTVTVREVHGAAVSVEDEVLAVNRGQSAQFTATIENLGNVRDALRVEVRQDLTWDVSIDGQAGSSNTVEVDPASTLDVTIAVAIPSGVAEGSTNVLTLTARPEGGGAEGSFDLRLIVEPDYGAAISGPTTTLDVEPGEESTFDITVRNAGNTQDTLTLRLFSNATDPNHLWEARVSNPTLELAAGNERTVTVTVNVPRGAAEGEASDVTVVVRSAGSGLQESSATVTLRVPEDTNDGPLPFLLVPLALAAAALRRRRGTP